VDIRLHRSVGEFREVAEPLYTRDAVLNTIELTALRTAKFADDVLLLTVWDDGVAVGAALQVPPYPLACNGLPVDVHQPVAAEVMRIRPDLDGVRGCRELAVAFADAWHRVTGRAHTVTMEEMLYRLGTLRPPGGVSGVHRDATRTDHALLADWVELFLAETGSRVRDDAAGQRFVDNATIGGDLFVLWEDGGTPVSLAMLRAPSAGVSRIGPVFTPERWRGHGYGSAVTAAAAHLARLDGVDDVVLFADLANPTSNAIYQRIGFEAVADSVRVEFASSPGD
jgi:GNAT superfamily N-acetyltransferase